MHHFLFGYSHRLEFPSYQVPRKFLIMGNFRRAAKIPHFMMTSRREMWRDLSGLRPETEIRIERCCSPLSLHIGFEESYIPTCALQSSRTCEQFPPNLAFNLLPTDDSEGWLHTQVLTRKFNPVCGVTLNTKMLKVILWTSWVPCFYPKLLPNPFPRVQTRRRHGVCCLCILC